MSGAPKRSSDEPVSEVEEDLKQGAVRVVDETGKPCGQVARELGVNEGTLGNWVAKARRAAAIRR